VSDALDFAPGLYRGTAGYYERFRVPYPPELIDDLVGRARPSGRGRLLDLACGTGQITFAVAARFAEVWSVDQEPDMIEVVRGKARAAGAARVHPVVSSAESLDAPPGAFELVAIGNAFHRLGRDVVAANAFRWLAPRGSIALLWASSPLTGKEDWQIAMSSLLSSWETRLGAGARVPAGWERVREERPDHAVLKAAGFELVHSSRFPAAHDWTVDALIGFVYSTSLFARPFIGDRARAFERDVDRELAEFTTDGRLSEVIDFAYELARRPP